MSGRCHRKFHDLPTRPPETLLSGTIPRVEDDQGEKTPNEREYDLLSYINESVIGKEKVFSGPFGDRKIVYCDYTASGRSLSFIEEYIRREVLPDYGNTHTTTTATGLQTTLFRHEARDIIRNACRASDHDAVVFVSSGCTGAVTKLIYNLNLPEKPIVFVGPFEHHSNLLPWREMSAECVRIRSTPDGEIDFNHLEQELKARVGCERPMIGTFSAASNITGQVSDVDRIAATLHRYGAKAFFDYATAAPYLAVDMNPVVSGPNQGLVHKDAVFFSMHKFVGGVQTPGVLIAKRDMFRSRVNPHEAGGGTVFFVRRENELFLQDVEEREEGGTPAIVESIRAGLVMQLKQAVTAAVIEEKEQEMCNAAWITLSDCPQLVVLGSSRPRRLPIFSFLCRAGVDGRFLHYNFVTAVLNDVFGIQARAGCACAGPYAMDLLGIDEATAIRFEEALVGSGLEQFVRSKYFEFPHREILRPGFTRINLPYFASREEVSFILSAIRWVSEKGWRLLPYYRLYPETGEWRHRGEEQLRGRRWLGFVSYHGGRMSWRVPARKPVSRAPPPATYVACLSDADELLESLTLPKSEEMPDDRVVFDDSCRHLLWFLLPSEAAALAAGNSVTQIPCPFLPGSILPCTIANSPSTIETESEQPSKSIVRSSENFQQRMTSMGNSQLAVTSSEKSQPVLQPSSNDQSAMTSSRDFQSTVTSSVNSHLGVKSPENDIPAVTSSENSEHASLEDVEYLMKRPNDEIEQIADTNNSREKESANPKFRPQNKQKKTTIVKKPMIYRSLWRPPIKELFKPMLQAMDQYRMIEDGDKVLVCLSGGKDSLSLLHTLRQYQRYAAAKGVHFALGGATVDPGTPAFDPSPLIPYLAQLEVPYFYEKQDIIDTAVRLPYECDSICAFCSRMKRGRLYACARREGYNVLAMGQHLDDLAESFLMSAFHNGSLRTMKANYRVKEGDLRVIRPFVFVREKHTRQFADQAKLPVIPENCPACFDAPKERFRLKQLLAEQEVIHPKVYNSLSSALQPLMALQRGNQIYRHEDDEEVQPNGCVDNMCSYVEE